MNKFFLYLLLAFCGVTMFSCEKELSLENYNQQKAGGSLWDSSGNCMPDSVHGTFYNGVLSGSDTAFVEIKVNVTQTGAYSILSSLENGFQFADSGFFTTTGINTIRLKQLGIPIIPTTSTFSISFDSSVCSFSVVIKDSTGTGLGGNPDTSGNSGGGGGQVQAGQWKYTQGTQNYSGVFDSASLDNSSGVATFVHMGAGETTNADTSLTLSFTYLGTTIKPGTYTMLGNSILFSSIDLLQNFSYTANAFVTGSDFTIVVSSYNTTTKEMVGTFSGKVLDKNGAIVPITNGSFDIIFP